jgi:hypothetical protein
MRVITLLLTVSLAGALAANDIDFEVRGIEGSLLVNAQSSIENLKTSDDPPLSERRVTWCSA